MYIQYFMSHASKITNQTRTPEILNYIRLTRTAQASQLKKLLNLKPFVLFSTILLKGKIRLLITTPGNLIGTSFSRQDSSILLTNSIGSGTTSTHTLITLRHRSWEGRYCYRPILKKGSNGTRSLLDWGDKGELVYKQDRSADRPVLRILLTYRPVDTFSY